MLAFRRTENAIRESGDGRLTMDPALKASSLTFQPKGITLSLFDGGFILNYSQ
jgi:hypothetical protein